MNGGFNPATVRRTEVKIGRGTVTLRDDDLDRLVEALDAGHSPAASALSEEIGALRLARVRIELRPTEPELLALREAIERAAPPSRPAGSSLVRLLALCN